jgi:hypothetical protein
MNNSKRMDKLLMSNLYFHQCQGAPAVVVSE